MFERRAAMATLLANRPKDLFVVPGLGSCTWDAFAAGDDDRNFYLWGAMGGAAMIGLGLALAKPDIKAILVENEFPWGPYGAKGLGETPIIGIAPAVTAAIHHATGARLFEIPATPERVWAALRRKMAPAR